MTNRLRKGGSLSGRERNCAFLNLDGRRFATISGVSGFDFPDDARALALVDWNGDGLMDVWSSNRTAPRVRFLQNQLTPNKNWIQFELKEKGFLDPIGARVEVGLEDGRILMRSLRAGEGFLGQSSRFLHFGLGEGKIESIKVRWPDGEWQPFAPVDRGRRYLLERDKKQPVPASKPSASLVEGGDLGESAVPASPWIRMPMSVALPPLLAAQPGAKPVMLPPSDGKPFLINLWDPTCVDCLVELGEWTANRSRLPDGLRIAALLANPETSDEAARNYLAEIKMPFAWGRLDPSSTALLAKFLQQTFQTRDAFAAPATFLVDGQGHLVSFSIGKVTVDEIAAEVAALPTADEGGAARLSRVYGSKGVWLDPAKYQNLLFVPRDLMEKGQTELAALYVRRAWTHLARHRDIDRVLVWIGDEYFKKGQAVEGLKFHLNALSNGTKDPIVMNNVAWQLSTHPSDKVRDGNLAVRWAEKAVAVTGGKEATYYDTLAAAYAETGQFEKALAMVAKGLELAKRERNAALIRDFRAAGQLYARKMPRRSQ
jgi:tetratricopeptide (TPR) repeat protein